MPRDAPVQLSVSERGDRVLSSFIVGVSRSVLGKYRRQDAYLLDTKEYPLAMRPIPLELIRLTLDPGDYDTDP